MCICLTVFWASMRKKNIILHNKCGLKLTVWQDLLIYWFRIKILNLSHWGKIKLPYSNFDKNSNFDIVKTKSKTTSIHVCTLKNHLYGNMISRAVFANVLMVFWASIYEISFSLSRFLKV